MLDRARLAELRVVARPMRARAMRVVARSGSGAELGFRGALILGAFVYGYMSRFAVATWGAAWMERGTIAARFRRPV
jgi:hypothetical protein